MVKIVRSMQKISYAGCPGLSPAVLLQFSITMCDTAQDSKEIHPKPLYWGFKIIQSHQCWHP